MEIELTSQREDGSWTWRAAGAREPRGTVNSELLSTSSAIGDVIRVEVEQFMDGIEVTSVLPGRSSRSEPELLEIIGSGQNEPLVTTTLAKGRSRRRGRDGEDRTTGTKSGRERREKQPKRSKETRKGQKSSTRRSKEGRGGTDNRSVRREPAKQPPRAKRLRPRRTNRKAAISALPQDQQGIARILLQDGIPGLRKAIERQNSEAQEAGEPPIPAPLLLKFAEQIYPELRSADWRDRAEAALAGIDEIDLRDLRSVVVAAELAARGDESRVLAEKLSTELGARVDREHQTWLADIDNALNEDRVVRALRLSSRPPKAGAPLPTQLMERLTHVAEASLTSETSQDRWVTVLDAVALSPVHAKVTPNGIPTKPDADLLESVKRASVSAPAIAAAFGIKPTPQPRKRRRSPRN